MSDKVYYRKQHKQVVGPSLLVFVIFVVGFSVVNLFWPKREVSDLENRKLSQFPAFSVKALLDGDWADGFASYLQDQVALRDRWIDLQSAVNTLGFQQVEQSNILLGKDHWMFTKLFDDSGSNAQLSKNVSAVSEFAARYPGRVTFLLAPSASVIYPEELPLGAPMMDENTLLDQIFEKIGQTASVIDLRSTYTAAKDQYLYFKTDHHWTPNGAYLAYEQFCHLKGLTPFDRDAHTTATVEDFYGTHYSASRWWNTEADTITYYPLENLMTVYQITGEAQYTPLKTEPMINSEKFATRDKYAAFLDGNNGYSVVEGDGEGSILVVKDSYANSFVPYLTANYAKIGIVDFRGFGYGLDSTISAEGYDQILVLYNFQTFRTDNKVVYINRPTTLTAQ